KHVPLAILAGAYGAHDLLLAPPSQPGRRVGGEVRRADRAEAPVPEGHPTAERPIRVPLRVLRVTVTADGRVAHQVLAALRQPGRVHQCAGEIWKWNVASPTADARGQEQYWSATPNPGHGAAHGLLSRSEHLRLRRW